MRRVLAISLALLILLSLSAYAEAPKPMKDSMFDRAKEAVCLISYEQFSTALSLLKFKDSSITSDTLKTFINRNCRSIYDGVQREVSVAWHDGRQWLLAVPLEDPDDDAVGALVFLSADGTQFDRLEFMRWEKVKAGYEASMYVYWNVEYQPGKTIIVGDW